MKEFPRKFLSLRDRRSGEHHRSKSAPPTNKAPRPLSADAFRSLFKNDPAKLAAAAVEDAAKDEAKIEDIRQLLEDLRITNVSDDHIKAIMATKYADGDVVRTAEFIDIEQKSSAGLLIPYNPAVQMVGAENRSAVTCYLDSLLFAMFSKIDAFECMLKNDFPEGDPRCKLVNLLRIWVNMLRTGKLIRTDLTKLIQDTLADCGWPDAKLLEQQDTSEAFAFLTEKLELPLLSLQVDLFHQGKHDKDDHKIVYERLLNLAVPPDPEDKGVKLEDCLEEYFNTQVDVLRDREESKKSFSEDKGSDDISQLLQRNSFRFVRGEESVPSPTTISSPILESPSTPRAEPTADSTDLQSGQVDGSNGSSSQTETPQSPTRINDTTAPPILSARNRSASVIQRVAIDDLGRPASSEASTVSKSTKRKGSVIVKAVTIPAWQFFRLIPWHAVNNKEPQNNMEVAMSFDKRPVVGICLKRYAMTETGRPKRQNTYIDIPSSMRLPHFMFADGLSAEEEANGLLNAEYKLVLQSVICHRGDSVQSGHYIAFARIAPKLLTDNRRHDADPPPDYEEAQWVKFDDLEIENRVTYVDDIRQSLKEEMPYLLFYQIVPMVDMSVSSTEDTSTEPPSYNESKSSLDVPRVSTSDGPFTNSSLSSKTDFEDPVSPGANRLGMSKPPSIRLSSEIERPQRKNNEYFGSVAYTDPMSGSRRQSVAFTDSPSMTPDAQSPALTPVDESTPSRLSRAASRFSRGRQSRPGSQSGEGRISSTMSRLGFIRSKDPLAEPTSLNISISNSTGQMSPQPESPVDSEKPLNQPPSGDKPEKSDKPDKVVEKSEKPEKHEKHEKHKHKRKKSKDKQEKHEKQKSGEQPERECTVM